MKVSPCYKCIEHEFGCRSGCSLYAEFEEAHKIYKQRIIENKKKDTNYYGWKKDTKVRINKGLNKK